MKTLLTAASVLALTGAASAGTLQDLLIVDLTVPNQITINSTGNASAATISGSTGIGALLAGFYNGTAFGGSGDTLVSGNLTSFLDTSDGTPDLFNFSTSEGLNIWSWAVGGTANFTAGTQAFSGSATWTLTADSYARMLAGNSSGTIYFPADSDDDIAGATAIGTWALIPTPGTAGLLGLAGLAAVRRRR